MIVIRASARNLSARNRSHRVRRRALSSAREDPIDSRHGCERVDRGKRITQLVERTVEGDADAGDHLEHAGKVFELELAGMREANDEAVDSRFGERLGRAAKRRPFARVGRVPGVLTDHDAQRQRHLRGNLANERQRRRQPTVVDRAHHLETIGAAARGLARVRQALDDDFEKSAFHGSCQRVAGDRGPSYRRR